MEDFILKRFTLILGVLTTILGLVVAYLYFDFQKEKVKKDHFFLKTDSVEQTWKTYKNEFLSFYFKYPSYLTYNAKFPKEPQLYEWVSFYEKDQKSPSFTIRINQVTPADHKIFNQATLATSDNKPIVYEEKINNGIKRYVSLIPIFLNSINWIKTNFLEDNQNYWVYLTTKKKDEVFYTIAASGYNKTVNEVVETLKFN